MTPTEYRLVFNQARYEARFLPAHAREDAASEILVLVLAAWRYDPARSTLSTYITRMCRWARYRIIYRQRPPVVCVAHPPALVVEPDDWPSLWVEQLPARERTLTLALLESRGRLREAARLAGLPVATAHRVRRRIQERYRESR